MKRFYAFVRSAFATPRYPPRYDLAPGHAVISGNSGTMLYWVDDTRAKARSALALLN